jgi:hypothetical protein
MALTRDPTYDLHQGFFFSINTFYKSVLVLPVTGKSQKILLIYRSSYFKQMLTTSLITDGSLTRVNSTNVLDEGLRIGEIGRWMNSKVKLVEIGMCQK